MRYDDALGAFVELAASRHNAVHSSEAAEIIGTRQLRSAEKSGIVYRLYPRVWANNQPPGDNPTNPPRGDPVVRERCSNGHVSSLAAWMASKAAYPANHLVTN